MQWICENGHQFNWIRKGEATKPDKCPHCGSRHIDAVEG